MDIKNLPDEDLAVYVREQDRNVFKELVSRHETDLIKYTSLILGNELVAYELLTESFISVFKNLNQFNPRSKFSTFIYKHIHQKLEEYYSRRPSLSQKEFSGIEEEFILEEDMVIEFKDREFLSHLVKNAQKLPLKYKEPLALHFIRKKSYEEIADILQTGVSIVALRISIGKNLIQKHVKN